MYIIVAVNNFPQSVDRIDQYNVAILAAAMPVLLNTTLPFQSGQKHRAFRPQRSGAPASRLPSICDLGFKLFVVSSGVFSSVTLASKRAVGQLCASVHSERAA